MKNFFTTLLATLIGLTLSMLLLFGVAMGSVAVYISGEDASALKVEPNSVLEISMKELITDAPLVSSVRDIVIGGGSTPRNVSLLNALLAIERAQSDPHIVAISMRMDGLGGASLANVSELRAALLEFKQVSKKPIYAYAESYSQLRYLFVSVADKIFIHPLGGVEWKGVGMSSLFYGDLVDKLDLKPEVFRPRGNEYKSAIEPFIRRDMSIESRRQNQRLANSLWGSVLNDVSTLHSQTRESLNQVAEQLILVDAQQAEKLGLVQYVGYDDEYIEALATIGVEVDGGEYNSISLSKYSRLVAFEREKVSSQYSDNTIAVIYIDGTIVDGSGDSGDSSVVGSESVTSQLREAREDGDVKGVVVRVNSPGGSAMASDVIWREMMLVQEQKPLIVTMGAYAASGGYYVSAPADLIIASDYTITGSIGVYGVMFDAEAMLKNKLYITMDEVGSTQNANFGKLPNGITPLQRVAIQRSVDDIYTSFVTKVASGRNMNVEQVEDIAGGRVWSGAEAKRLGLVDNIGGLKQALLLAMERSGIGGGEARIIEMGEDPNEWSVIIDLFMSRVPRVATKIFEEVISSQIDDSVSALRHIFGSQSGVVAHSPMRIEF